MSQAKHIRERRCMHCLRVYFASAKDLRIHFDECIAGRGHSKSEIVIADNRDLIMLDQQVQKATQHKRLR